MQGSALALTWAGLAARLVDEWEQFTRFVLRLSEHLPWRHVPMALVLLLCLLPVAVLCGLAVRRRRNGRRPSRTRASLAARGLGPVPLHGRMLYPVLRTGKRTPPASPRSRSRPARRYRDTWYWHLAEHLLIAAVGAAVLPTLLLALGVTAEVSRPAPQAGLRWIQMWLAVASAWREGVFVAAFSPAVIYAGTRVLAWDRMRQGRARREGERARRAAALKAGGRRRISRKLG